MTTRQGAADRRAAAAQLRRDAATTVRHERGDRAYQQFRLAPPGGNLERRKPRVSSQLRGQMEPRNGKDLYHTYGFYTRYNVLYSMWDEYGPYEEGVRPGAGRATLAAKPEVMFLVNHTDMAMARTKNGTLLLEERDEGGWHDAWLNPERSDVANLRIAINDGTLDQMSFAFMIPEGGGEWSEDFEKYWISAYDMEGGDVSAVNRPANPHTDITGRAADVLDDLELLPAGALDEAVVRLNRRAAQVGRERIEVPALVRSRADRDAADVARVVSDRLTTGGPSFTEIRVAGESGSPHVRRLQGRLERTAKRFADLAATRRLTAEQMMTARLPWYDIRNADGDGSDRADEAEDGIATVYIYDEIGGSFGTSAKQFAADLDAITAPRINVRINSPGGSVFEGVDISSSMMLHPSKVRSIVGGYAASAASIIAVAADFYDADADTGGVMMMPGSQMMIHDASLVIDGQAADLMSAAKFLERQSDNIAGMYARRGGGEPSEWRALMKDETWTFDQETVDLGLADFVYEAPRAEREVPPAEPDLEERMAYRGFDLGAFGYRYLGRENSPRPQTRAEVVARPLQVRGTEADPQRSSGNEQKGRSLALIEAELQAEGFDI